MKKTLQNYIGILAIIAIAISCKKQDEFLDAKPNAALSVITTIQDCELLLQNEELFNNAKDPTLGTLSTDEFYVSSDAWSSAFTNVDRNAYIYTSDIYEGNTTYTTDWDNPYQQVYYSNVVLDALPKLRDASGQQAKMDQLKGMALFYRAYAFYNLAQTFALPYDANTSKADLGIPLRLTPDINIKSTRATVSQCYDQVIADLKTALALLPAIAAYKTQPSKWAVNAMLARVHLAMGLYSEALQYADACLTQNSTLTDYNTLSPTVGRLSRSFLEEDIYHAAMPTFSLISRSTAIVDSNLYKLYADNDLRKSKCYALQGGAIRFRGTYDYSNNKYTGLATDEMYLIKAECEARAGKAQQAMQDLNTLLQKRWLTGTFVPFQASDAEAALKQILTERRKELVFRGLRWTDLRRLNKDDRFKVTLTRVINNKTYTLEPNSPKYAMPIPDQEIRLSGIPQNIR